MALLTAGLSASAQYRGQSGDEPTPGFKKEQLFTGGSVNLGFSNSTTNLGIAPQFGISLTPWIDVGVNVNINYAAQRDLATPDKWRQTTIGPGVFARVFPVSMLFASVQYEYNFITAKYIPQPPAGIQKRTVQAPALLLGLGYAGGRMKGSNTYYYFSVSADFAGHENSPYIDRFERMLPIIRAGYNIGLFQGKNQARY